MFVGIASAGGKVKSDDGSKERKGRGGRGGGSQADLGDGRT